jgi:hypothetical protein
MKIEEDRERRCNYFGLGLGLAGKRLKENIMDFISPLI